MSEADRRPSDGALSLLAHDLKTPLGPLALAVSTLAEGFHPPEETRGLARLALTQTDRLRRLIDAALIAGGREPSSSPTLFSLDGLIREVVLQQAAAGVTVSLGAFASVYVVADRGLLRDAVAGLIEVAASGDRPTNAGVALMGDRVVVTIGGGDSSVFAQALCADHADTSESAFAIAGRHMIERFGGGIEVIDAGIVVWLPRADASHALGAA